MYDQETGLVTRKSRCSAGGHLETQMIDTGDVYSVTATADTALDTLLVNEGSELPSANNSLWWLGSCGIASCHVAM